MYTYTKYIGYISAIYIYKLYDDDGSVKRVHVFLK